MDSDWNDLKVLLALARGGSVAAAARALSVDQSTVSRRLSALEESLGAALLVRGGREFAWTAEGRTMLAAAEAAESAMLAATQQLRSAKLDSSGAVRVSSTPGMAAFLLRILPEYEKKHPGLKFELIASVHRADLAKGEADIALRGGAPTEPDLIARKVGRVGWCVFASEAYLKEAGWPGSFSELHRHRLVLMQRELHTIAPGLRWLEDYCREATEAIRVDNMQSAAQMAALGRGLVVLPLFNSMTEPALVRVFAEPVSYSDAYIVYHVSQRGKARIQAAVDVMSEAIEAHRDVWSGALPASGDGGKGRPPRRAPR